MKTLFLIVPFLLAAAGCAGSDYEPWLTRGQYNDREVSRDRVTLERTACFGVCPVYTVVVDERDVLEFRGKRFVTETGGAVGKSMPAGSFKKLVDIARSYKFEAFDAAYPNEDRSNCPQLATDLPSVIVTLERDGREKSVRVNEGCFGFDGRERFQEMVSAMDAVFAVDDLVGPREAFVPAKKDDTESDKENEG